MARPLQKKPSKASFVPHAAQIIALQYRERELAALFRSMRLHLHAGQNSTADSAQEFPFAIQGVPDAPVSAYCFPGTGLSFVFFMYIS